MRSIFTGRGKLIWVPDATGAGTVVTLGAPTSTQVNTGTDITGMLRRDGLKRPQSGSTVDSADSASRFNKTIVGTYGGDAVEIMLYRDTVAAQDIAWPLFGRDKAGFLIVLPWGTAGATPAVGDRVEVWQCQVISREMADIADNEAQRFTAKLAVISTPNDDAVLV